MMDKIAKLNLVYCPTCKSETHLTNPAMQLGYRYCRKCMKPFPAWKGIWAMDKK